MGLRMFVRGFGLRQLAGLVIHIMVALAWTINAIGPMQASVEPLWGIGCHTLGAEHVTQFIKEGARISVTIEIAAFPAPVSPCAGQTIEYLLSGHFRTEAFLFRQLGKRFFVRDGAPQPRWDRVFFYTFQHDWDACFTEIFLSQNVSCDLRPACRNIDIV